MGNCASEPKTNEGRGPIPEMEELVKNNNKEVKVEDDSHNTKTNETLATSLGALLKQNEKKEAREADKPKKEEEPRNEMVKPMNEAKKEEPNIEKEIKDKTEEEKKPDKEAQEEEEEPKIDELEKAKIEKVMATIEEEKSEVEKAETKSEEERETDRE